MKLFKRCKHDDMIFISWQRYVGYRLRALFYCNDCLKKQEIKLPGMSSDFPHGPSAILCLQLNMKRRGYTCVDAYALHFEKGE